MVKFDGLNRCWRYRTTNWRKCGISKEKPAASVISPGVMRNNPAIKIKSPLEISMIGLLSAFFNLNKIFKPCFFTAKEPAAAVARIVKSVHPKPIIWVILMKITISNIGTRKNIKNNFILFLPSYFLRGWINCNKTIFIVSMKKKTTRISLLA